MKYQLIRFVSPIFDGILLLGTGTVEDTWFRMIDTYCAPYSILKTNLLDCYLLLTVITFICSVQKNLETKHTSRNLIKQRIASDSVFLVHCTVYMILYLGCIRRKAVLI
jgi:hypothetical protein